MVALRHRLQERDIALNEVRFCGNGKSQSTPARENLEHRPCPSVTSFRRLIRIGRGAERNRFTGLYAGQFFCQMSFDVALGKNPVFELLTITQFHELVGVSGIAISATELAAPVRVEAPGERHAGPDPVERA